MPGHRARYRANQRNLAATMRHRLLIELWTQRDRMNIAASEHAQGYEAGLLFGLSVVNRRLGLDPGNLEWAAA